MTQGRCHPGPGMGQWWGEGPGLANLALKSLLLMTLASPTWSPDLVFSDPPRVSPQLQLLDTLSHIHVPSKLFMYCYLNHFNRITFLLLNESSIIFEIKGLMY